MKPTLLASVGLAVAAMALAVGFAYGRFTMASPDLSDSERLKALARIAAIVIRSAAPQERTAHIKLVQALPQDNVVETEFLVDDQMASLFASSRLMEIQLSIISTMCHSNLSDGFDRGLTIHSIYTTAQGTKLADFKVDRTSCSSAKRTLTNLVVH